MDVESNCGSQSKGSGILWFLNTPFISLRHDVDSVLKPFSAGRRSAGFPVKAGLGRHIQADEADVCRRWIRFELIRFPVSVRSEEPLKDPSSFSPV